MASELHSSASFGFLFDVTCRAHFGCLRSQYVIFLSYPVVITSFSSGVTSKSLIPPILCWCDVILFSFFRSHSRIVLSLEAETRWMSSLYR